MKTLLLTIWLTTLALVALAADSALPPFDAIEQFGAITLSDGSSYYKFSKDGSFESGPLGMSGRTFQGRWTKDDGAHLTVTAKQGWINGLSRNDDYRRIVFLLSHVTKRAERHAPRFGPTFDLFDGYFLIEELTTITKPPELFSK